MNNKTNSDQDAAATRNIALSFAMTHTPGLSDRLDDAPAAQLANIMTAFDVVKEQIREAKPDLMIALINDHFDMFSLNNMPTFAVGVADKHYGPPKREQKWMQVERREHQGAKKYAKHLLENLIEDGFDIARIGSCEFKHNVILPKRYLWPDTDIPIVPVFMNCFCRPLPSWRRCYELGQSIRRFIASRSERVCIFASGGISHWPPFVDEEEVLSGDDTLGHRILEWQTTGAEGLERDPTVSRDLREKEKEMAASGRELINVEWDQRILRAMNEGDHEFLCNLDGPSILRDGGNGGYEMAMWVSLMGALDNAPSKTLVYEPVKEWMGGVGVISYA